MYFAKDEVIELYNGKKHIVVDTLSYEGIYYYYVCEVIDEQVIDNIKVITTKSENGQLFIKTITGPLEEKLKAMFEKNIKDGLETDE